MRVIMRCGAYPTNPCPSGNLAMGEVEDYNVMVISAANKALPIAGVEIMGQGGDAPTVIELANIFTNPVKVGQEEMTLIYRLIADADASYGVYSMDGRLLSSKVTVKSNTDENRMRISLPPLVAGMYSIIVSTKQGGHNFKKFTVR